MRQVIGVRAFTVGAALCVVALGLGLAARPDPANRLGVPALTAYELIAIGVTIAALAQLARIRVRAGAGVVHVAWGEAAIVGLCYLLPAGWVPAVAVVGVTVAQLLLHRLGDRRSWIVIATNAAGLGLASGAAAAVARLLGVTPGAPVTGRLVVALSAAGLTYCLVGSVVIGWHVAATSGGRPWRTVRDTLKSKLVMAVGNIVIGLAGIVAVSRTGGWWLLALPPVVWLLHQTYVYRLRGDDERRTWQQFAEATRQLNRLDEQDTASAGLQGARSLFGVRSAELVVNGPPGRARAYVMSDDGNVREAPLGASAGSQDADPVTVRPLLVGGVRIGELRLRLAQSRPLTGRDSLMLAAYGDALAAALHDAVANTELRALSARTTYEAAHDPLTGLANRAVLLARGNATLRALRPEAAVALLLLDIDDFKQVNTTLGHAAGDELLKIAAGRLGGATVPGELLARLGGDEFAVLLTASAAPPRDALARARELAGLLATPTEVAGVQLSVEASVGVVTATAGGVDITELLRRADIAMYQAKRGQFSVARYDPSRDAASTDRLALLAELREALIAHDQLSLVLQPAVALDTGWPVGVEALVRWHHPRRGTLEPTEFVDVVEQSELIGPFTRYVLGAALSIAAQLAREGFALPVSVNVSARSLLDPLLPTEIRRMLAHNRVPPDRLVLEITERVVMSELPVVDDVLAGLRALGVQLAVDDFGTGYSSLTFLTRVTVDEVKIDRSFVDQIVDSPEAAAIVRTTVELARELGLRVVAEGVETSAQRSALAALGCPAAQGKHFYPPMPLDKLSAVLRALLPPRPHRGEATG
jgi:diguanylate cyclase (GGDEF)-like protein